MRRIRSAVLLVAFLAGMGCSTAPEVESATLRCMHPFKAGSFIGFLSFEDGGLAPVTDPDHVDVAYYFDNNDCSEGALIGHDDRPGYLFPIGHKSWRELIKLDPPRGDTESVDAIAPLTKDTEGLALWVKTEAGEYYLVRIKTVQPATYADLVAGKQPQLGLEWRGPIASRTESPSGATGGAHGRETQAP
ncbi:MAG: hypothetical protein GY851_13045 [bacterium]|nr:hypothetical protein [bacterium]